MVENDFFFKIVLLGKYSVGKTACFERYCDDIFIPTEKIPTIGIDFKNVTYVTGNKQIKVHMYDTAGQERFSSIVSTYCRGSHGFILVYDITDKTSLEKAKLIYDDIKAQHDKLSAAQWLLIGNKMDLPANRQISFYEGKQFADENNMLFSEVSACNGLNIKQSVDGLINAIYMKKNDYICPFKHINCEHTHKLYCSLKYKHDCATDPENVISLDGVMQNNSKTTFQTNKKCC